MYIKVKVTPGSKKERVEKVKEDTYHVSVREKAENNRTNERVLEIFRTMYPKTDVRIISGHHSPSKILSIDTA